MTWKEYNKILLDVIQKSHTRYPRGGDSKSSIKSVKNVLQDDGKQNIVTVNSSQYFLSKTNGEHMVECCTESKTPNLKKKIGTLNQKYQTNTPHVVPRIEKPSFFNWWKMDMCAILKQSRIGLSTPCRTEYLYTKSLAGLGQRPREKNLRARSDDTKPVAYRTQTSGHHEWFSDSKRCVLRLFLDCLETNAIFEWNRNGIQQCEKSIAYSEVPENL